MNNTPALNALVQLRFLFSKATHACAQSCSIKGQLNAQLLDLHQPSSYELAWCAAELLAAETAVSSLHAKSSELDIRLALLFMVDATTSIITRMESLFIDLSDAGKQSLSALHAFSTSIEWIELRRSAASESALATTGNLFVQGNGEITDVVVPEPTAMARESFRRFASEVVAPMAEEIHRQDLTVPESLLKPMREMGVFGLSIPARFGGSSPDDRDDTQLMVAVTEALSEASLAAAGSLITRPEILSRALLVGGSPEQQAHWLPRIACGDPLCAIAMTEPDYGSDVAGLSLKATRVVGGWVVNGAKTWCTFAGKAGLLMVVARTDPDRSLGHKGLSLLLIEKPSFDGHEFDFQSHTGGRLRGKAIPTIGYRGMHSFDLSFHDFFVPEQNIIGGEGGLGKGFYLTMAGMMGGRMQTAARSSGVMRAALKAAVRYAIDRKVFGAPLSDYSLTRAKLVRMAARFSACRQLAYAIAVVMDSGGGRMEASLVKLLACRSAEIITRDALQIHGGMGYAEESAVSRYFVDARVLSIFEGAEETLALKVVARSLMEQSLQIKTETSRG